MAINRRKKPKTNATIYWVILLLVAGALLFAWWIWSCFYNVTPRFHFILVQKNEHPLKLLNGEVLKLHPRDRLKIQKISTNICFNRGVRLAAEGIDINALRYEEKAFSDLLPGGDMFNHYRFKVTIKQENHNLGHLDLVIEPLLDDWLEKASRTIDAKRRIAILEKALDLAPEKAAIEKRLLEEYKSQKDWAKAGKMLEKMAKSNPRKEVLADLLEVYGATGNLPGTIRVLDQLTKMDPDDVGLRLRLAEAYEKAKDRKGAIKAYEALLKRLDRQDRLEIYKTLGFLYTETKQFKKAIHHYRGAVSLDKGDVNLLYNLSHLYEQIGDKNHADEFLSKAVKLQSHDTESRLKLAQRLIEKKDLKRAEKYLQEVLKEDPNSLNAHLLMIPIMEKRGDKEGLKRSYRKILVHEPGNETIIYNLGVLEYETGQLDKSLSYFKKYIKKHPKDAEIHAFLLDIYKKKKKGDLACKESSILLQLRPKEKDNTLFQLNCLNRRSDYEAIIGISKQGLKYYPKDIALREYLILAYLKTGKRDLAMAQMKEALKGRPDNTSMLLRLAKLQEKVGKIPEAISTYGKLSKIAPGNKEAKEAYPRLLLQLARAQEKEGKKKQALETYQKLMEISPDNEEAEEAYLRLRLQVLPHGK